MSFNDVFSEYDTAVYVPKGLQVTVLEIVRDDSGNPIQYLVELNEGYEGMEDRTLYVPPEDLRKCE